MNNQKLLTKPEDLAPEDVSGYQGMFFTDANPAEIILDSKKWFNHPGRNDYGNLTLSDHPGIGFGTTLRISENKPKFEELAELLSKGFIMRIDCFGAGKPLSHVDDFIKNLLSRGRRVVLFPFTKNKPEPLDPENLITC